jgi:hypothetical protein
MGNIIMDSIVASNSATLSNEVDGRYAKKSITNASEKNIDKMVIANKYPGFVNSPADT